MNKYLKIIDKVSNISTLLLFIGIFASIWVPVLKYLTIISSCLIYICILIKNRIVKGKFDLIMAILCSFALLWVIAREFYNSPYINVLGLFIVYSFLVKSFKENTGKWNWFVLGYGSLAIVLSVLNIFVDWKIISWLVIALQFYIIFKFLDPILEKIGMEKRRKRLAHEARLREEAEAKKREQESEDLAVISKNDENYNKEKTDVDICEDMNNMEMKNS